jgi:hypothetical protein
MARWRLPWRLTGISTPIAGVQWEHHDGDHEVVRRVLNALEDRRVLFGERLAVLCADYDIEVVGRLGQIVPSGTDWLFVNFHHGSDAYAHVRED